MNREKESIRTLEPYVTNPTVCSVKLDANEGDKDLYLDLLKKLGNSDLKLNYYPDDSYTELKKEINNYVGYEPKNITVGNGSSELLDLCVKTFLDKDEMILSLDPTFSMYSIYAQVFSAKYVGAKTEDDFKLNVDSIIEDIQKNSPKLIILCNPNNPTGSVLTKEEVRKMIVHEGRRPDARKTDEIRPIWCDCGFIPRTHGSGLFTRGQTQVMTITTLGALGDVQILDGLDEEESKRYMHHYNFPAYSVGEVRPSRGPGRREIGHGALAERALLPVIPSKEEFPYAIRLVSEVLSSNGSTSQGSVCGSTLSLLDAGVPIKDMVAGIAMGLIEQDGKIAILSDIQGMEDHLGDMDFKVAGTAQGVTALQMDIKIEGLSREILEEALQQAKVGRMQILNHMLGTIAETREDLSAYAPKIKVMTIKVDKIRDVIGPGGKQINEIIDKTGVKIDIEQDGTVYILHDNTENINQAVAMIEDIVREVEVGKIYLGKVVRIEKFGAFVEIFPGQDGLVHISQLAEERVAKTEDVVNVGDQIHVKVTEIDDRGRVNLSRKEAMKEQAEQQAE